MTLQTGIIMALTNYCVYKWLIFLLEKETDEQNCMTLEKISEHYRKDWQDIYKKEDGKTGRVNLGPQEKETKKKDSKGEWHQVYIKSNTFLNWRYAIYKEFGLLIQQPIVKGVVQNRYYLSNPELLDGNSNLREMIEHLVNDEQRGFEAKTLLTVSPRGRKPKAKGVSDTGGAMGFVSAGGGYVDYYYPQYGEVEEPEMVGILRFLMTIGEALVIRYGKSREWWERDTRMKQKEKPDRYVLEPQQLKCINGRWYVAGNLYEYGNRDTSRVSIYDVEQIQICEDEDIAAPRYEVVEGFDIYNRLPEDWTEHFDPDKVVSMYLRDRRCWMEKHPFCQAQMKVEFNAMFRLYQVYIKPDKDFFIQYMAYGDELVVFNPYKRIERTPIDLSDDQIGYLKYLRRTKL